jgi:hypothetical protein
MNTHPAIAIYNDATRADADLRIAARELTAKLLRGEETVEHTKIAFSKAVAKRELGEDGADVPAAKRRYDDALGGVEGLEGALREIMARICVAEAAKKAAWHAAVRAEVAERRVRAEAHKAKARAALSEFAKWQGAFFAEASAALKQWATLGLSGQVGVEPIPFTGCASQHSKQWEDEASLVNILVAHGVDASFGAIVSALPILPVLVVERGVGDNDEDEIRDLPGCMTSEGIAG